MANQNFIVTGGLYFTVPILLMGIASVLLFAWLLIRKLNRQDLNRKYVDLVLFLGAFSFIFGLFGQILGFYQAAGAIQAAKEISPTIIWGGFRVSLIAPIMGFTVLLLSSILWFVLKPGKSK